MHIPQLFRWPLWRAGLILIGALCGGHGLPSSARAAAAELSGGAIIEEYLKRNQLDSELAFIRMNTEVQGGLGKEYRFVVMTKKTADGGRNYLVRLIRPKDVEGVTVLALEKPEGLAQYIFLPDVGRSTRLAGGGQSGAFLGSDFSYEDLAHEIPRNFQYGRQPDARVGADDCYVVRARAAAGNATSAYLHRDLFIAKDDYRLLKINFHSRSGRLLKTLVASEYKSNDVKGESLRPRTALMTNLEKRSTTTFLVIESRLNLALADELFTTGKIEAWTPQELETLIFDLGIVSVKAAP